MNKKSNDVNSEVALIVDRMKSMDPSECARFFAMFVGMTKLDESTYKADTRVLDIDAIRAAAKLGGLVQLLEHPAARSAMVFRVPVPVAETFPGLNPR